jgi:hypothetical protein
VSTLYARLVAELDEFDRILVHPVRFNTALRAAVERHKPELFGGVVACLACSPGMPPPILVEAPCDEIKSIAEALGIGETPK